MPQPFCQPKSGSGTRSSRFPCTLRHKLIPGAPACVNARSIQPSLSKSKATTPTAGGNFSFAKSIASNGVNFPSRGFSRIDAPVAPPARTKSIARSLLKSVVTTPAPVAAAPSAVSAETSVNELSPLLRHKILCAAFPADPAPAARKTNARRLRYILKSPVAQVAQQMARPIRRAVHEKEIRLAIAVKVKKTRARACSDGHRDSTAAF